MVLSSIAARLVDMDSAFSQLDSFFEQRESNFLARRYERVTKHVGDIVMLWGEKLDQLARDMREAAPQQAELANRIAQDARHVFDCANQLYGCVIFDKVYGRGWGSTLDLTRAHLAAARDVFKVEA